MRMLRVFGTNDRTPFLERIVTLRLFSVSSPKFGIPFICFLFPGSQEASGVCCVNAAVSDAWSPGNPNEDRDGGRLQHPCTWCAGCR